ncbi:MAG: hypothetical protein Ct9H300mP25_00450 [Acidobacteriota bacterium]|nr:MAG: hypothetical protein Ct9H300mP25_00450 [Acidobacteriota bacterium]
MCSSSACPKCVRVPLYPSSLTTSSRSVSLENPKNRNEKRSLSADATHRPLLPIDPQRIAIGVSSRSAICMLRESSISTPRKFCCGTTDDSTRTGRSKQNANTASAKDEPRPKHVGLAADYCHVLVYTTAKSPRRRRLRPEAQALRPRTREM